MKSNREKIEVMQAYEMGEQIQIKNSKNVWEDIDLLQVSQLIFLIFLLC